ncbi:Lacal_2735 family protein [Ekhidna sp.]
MLRFLRKSKIESLQNKYDKLMKEAYVLSKANPQESLVKQKEAQEIHKQILLKSNSY